MTETIYNPEPIIKKLQELYRIVEGVEEENYDQNRWGGKYECGCAGHHYQKVHGGISVGDGFDQLADYFGIGPWQAQLIFGDEKEIEDIGELKNWPTFSDLPEQKAALKRIEFVIKQVGGEV